MESPYFKSLKISYISVVIIFAALFFGSSNLTRASFLKDEQKEEIKKVAIKSLTYENNFETETNFTSELVEWEEEIAFETKYIDDPEEELGTQKILEEGVAGRAKITEETIFWKGKFFAQNQEKEVINWPEDEVVARGTKIIIREMETQWGPVRYRQKLRMWATSYDKNCFGCSETTATGMRAGYGVVAVDPSVIPLGTQVYVPNYGIAVAGDVGGGIKGNMIDLGFDDLATGSWSARYTDVFILE